MTTHDIDPNGFLPVLRAVTAHLRAIIGSRSWRRTSPDNICCV